MIDIKAASISGAINYAKVRLLYKDGQLRGYGPAGLVFAVEADRPAKRSRWIGTWDCQTVQGPVAIKSQCWTCGGWWRVAGVSAGELWA